MSFIATSTTGGAGGKHTPSFDSSITNRAPDIAGLLHLIGRGKFVRVFLGWTHGGGALFLPNNFPFLAGSAATTIAIRG